MTSPNLVDTLLQTVQTGVMDNVTTALVPAGTVFAAIAGIFIGIKIFKRITGARA